jgi:hypothetical protein
MCRTVVNKLALVVAFFAVSTGVARGQDGGRAPVVPGQSNASRALDDVTRRQLMEGARGSLAVQVVQGTAGGAPVGAVKVRVDLYTDHPIWELNAQLDENGVALLGDLPIALTVRPVVWIEYDGVKYLEVGPPMDESNPDTIVKLTVYETSHDEPVWNVAMRHVMVSRSAEGTIVNETLVVENPVDQTWFGGEPMREDKATTVRVQLPAAATEVQLDSGFHGWCCTTIEGRELAVQMPLMPGQTMFRYTYLIPTDSETLDLHFSAVAPTASVVLFVPDDGTTAAATGMTLQGTESMGQQRMRSFQATGLDAGVEAGVVLTSLKPGESTSMPASLSKNGAIGVVVIIGGVVALGIVGVVLMRGRGG